jgi:hypothetical protein
MMLRRILQSQIRNSAPQLRQEPIRRALACTAFRFQHAKIEPSSPDTSAGIAGSEQKNPFEDVLGNTPTTNYPKPEFLDHKEVYKNKGIVELVRAYFVFSMCSFDFLMKHHVRVNEIHFYFLCFKTNATELHE